MRNSPLYDQDFFAWANEQAALLRAGKLDLADIDHIAEEIESMGRTEKRELVSRLAVLLTHLLKWRVQPSRRGVSWRLTIEEQRRALARHLVDNPSLKSRLDEATDDAYGDAVLRAARETGNDKSAFPSACPWLYEQIADVNFWPDES
jgi:ribosomal protein L29